MKTTVILGCGYTGKVLARMLGEQGVRVRGTTRSELGAEALARLGIEGRVLDTTLPKTLEGIAVGMDVVFDMIPPVRVSPRGEPECFVDPTAHLIRACEGEAIRRFVYLGSTAIYGSADAEWVDEDTPVRPSSPRSRARLEAEQAVLRAHRERAFPGVIVRAPGIYGPGRTPAHRIRKGAYRVPGDGQNYVNRIHVEDLARVLAAAAERGRDGAIYVAGDDCPERARVVADFCASLVGMPPAPSIDAAQAARSMGESDLAMMQGDKRIRNARMKEELGVVLRYPSYREGIPAALAEEDAGKH
jgi:nucleoside-diphosphate-sugar epimerase